jgi:Transposase DDE domain
MWRLSLSALTLLAFSSSTCGQEAKPGQQPPPAQVQEPQVLSNPGVFSNQLASTYAPAGKEVSPSEPSLNSAALTVTPDLFTGTLRTELKLDFPSGRNGLQPKLALTYRSSSESLTEQGVYFVTRLKENADYGVVEKREVPQRRGVLRDEVVFFYKLAQASQEAFFRRIEFYDEEHDRVLVFLTNHLELAAATVAAIYKERWQIELFFRALKQSLRVKTFVGTSANALKTQLWTALIAMLVVKYLQLRSTFGWSLSNLVALLRQQLFVYRDLWAWIDDPFQPPPIPERSSEQLTLQLI